MSVLASACSTKLDQLVPCNHSRCKVHCGLIYLLFFTGSILVRTVCMLSNSSASPWKVSNSFLFWAPSFLWAVEGKVIAEQPYGARG